MLRATELHLQMIVQYLQSNLEYLMALDLEARQVKLAMLE